LCEELTGDTHDEVFRIARQRWRFMSDREKDPYLAASRLSVEQSYSEYEKQKAQEKLALGRNG
jgi:hypothetical protein